eukprot:scaffold297463_cov37-Prasinocladus_malaysianus.AAC.1
MGWDDMGCNRIGWAQVGRETWGRTRQGVMGRAEMMELSKKGINVLEWNEIKSNGTEWNGWDGIESIEIEME